MRKHWPLFFIFSLILVLITLTIGQIVASLIFNLGLAGLNTTTATEAALKTIVTEFVALIIWWVVNKTYLKAHVGWGRGSRLRSWWLVIPVILVLIGDSTLGVHFSTQWSTILVAIVLGLFVAILEEYVFRGLFVSYLYSHFRLGAGLTACLSAVGFGLIHFANVFNGGDLMNTTAQVLGAVGMGFFLAAVYMVTNNLWIPIIFHTIVDAFDQTAFGTLSNTAGTSMVTSLIYFVVFIIIGAVVLARGRVQLAAESGSMFTSFDNRRHHHSSRPIEHADFSSYGSSYDSFQAIKVSPVKSIIAILIPLIELLFGAPMLARINGQMPKTIALVLMTFVGFLIIVWMYRDVLGQDWHQFTRHFWRNLLLAIGGVIMSYALLIAVRAGLKMVAAGTVTTTDVLSMSVQSAGIGLLASLTVLMAPFVEEVVFRHVLFFQWRGHKLFMFLMFFVSSIAFGLMHWNNFNGDVMAMIPYMVVGAWFALIYYWSKDIWQNITTHFLFNFVQFAGAIVVFVAAFLG